MKNSKQKSKTERLLALEKLFKEQLWQLLIVVAFVSFCAWLFDKWAEAIMFCVAHTIIRRHFEKQYHCSTTGLCLITTLTIAFFGISSILPITLSLLSTIPICCFISWVGYIAQDRLDALALNKKLKDLYCNEKETLLMKCRNAGLSERDATLAIMYFYEKKTPKEIWLWLCQQNVYDIIEWDSIYVALNRIGQKLKKVDKN
jgi:hypothetical protein